MGEGSKTLTGKFQEQMKEKAKEALGNLLKHSTKSGDLKQKGQDFLKGFLRQHKKHEQRNADQPLITAIMLSAPTPSPYSDSSRSFRRLSVGQNSLQHTNQSHM